MIVDIITIFPEFFETFLKTSIIKRAIEFGKIEIRLHNLRDYSHNKHQKVDDTPYGGGAGMLMAFPPFYDAICNLKGKDTKVIYPSPQGKILSQKMVQKLSLEKHLILICGHYEGIDARIEEFVDQEISIGDYILTGGEIPTMVILDSITRLIPGVITDESSETDSLSDGMLKYPQYTKPKTYQKREVPEVLLSGDHALIEAWRRAKSLENTLKKRPDLIDKAETDLE